jgi:hypothetical protein
MIYLIFISIIIQKSKTLRNMKKQRVTTYQVKFNEITIEGTVEVKTKWEKRIEDLNPTFLKKEGGVIIERSFEQ